MYTMNNTITYHCRATPAPVENYTGCSAAGVQILYLMLGSQSLRFPQLYCPKQTRLSYTAIQVSMYDMLVIYKLAAISYSTDQYIRVCE